MYNEIIKRKVFFYRAKDNKLHTTITIPILWLERLGITQNNNDIIIKFKDNKIFLFKDNSLKKGKNKKNIRYNKIVLRKTATLNIPNLWIKAMNITEKIPYISQKINGDFIVIEKLSNDTLFKSYTIKKYSITDVSKLLNISRWTIYKNYLDILLAKNYATRDRKILISDQGINYIKRRLQKNNKL